MRTGIISRHFAAFVVALFAAFSLSGSVYAQPLQDEPIAFYEAYIGTQDLYNSRGVRLSTAQQVLRQDRANVHKFGIWQPGDQLDPIFGSYEARDVMTWILERDGLDPQVANAIMGGDVMVYVEVWGHGNTITGIYVEAF